MPQVTKGVRKNMLREKRENDLLPISRDSRGEVPSFLEISILSSIAGDLFVTATSMMAGKNSTFS